MPNLAGWVRYWWVLMGTGGQKGTNGTLGTRCDERGATYPPPVWASTRLVRSCRIEPAAGGKISSSSIRSPARQWRRPAATSSGDERGQLRVWACDTPDQILKLDFGNLRGRHLDASSSWATAGRSSASASCGILATRSARSPATRRRSTRARSSRRAPFRLCTGGEDNKVNFYEGPPFKWKATCKTHDRFVNCTRFSPDGARFFSASSTRSSAFMMPRRGPSRSRKRYIPARSSMPRGRPTRRRSSLARPTARARSSTRRRSMRSTSSTSNRAIAEDGRRAAGWLRVG